MQKSKDLSGYFGKSKPENDGKPWVESDTKFLLETATTDLKVYGHPRIKKLADHFGRTDNAIVVQLSKAGWYKEHDLGQESHKNRKGTLKLQVLEYVRNHPWCFLKDVDKALKASCSSQLSTLYKEGKLKRIRHGGNGNYLYAVDEIPITIEKVEAKPGGTAPGTGRKINLNFFDGIRKLIFGRG